MEVTISSTPDAYNRIDEIHAAATQLMEHKTAEFLKDVQLGKDLNALFRWNDYVKDQLEIDNVEMFGITSVELEGN